MASISAPVWETNDGNEQVTKLPCMTKIVFEVTPRANLNGFQVQYRLHSARLVFKPFAGSALPPGEAAGSHPTPTSIRREDRVIVDAYEGVTTPTQVTRLLEIDLSDTLKPATASLDLTVFDVTADGKLKNRNDDTAGISFNL